MKRSLTITGIVLGIVVVLAIAALTITGPLIGNTFSTINAPLSYAHAPGIVDNISIPAMPAPVSVEMQSAYDATSNGGQRKSLDTSAAGGAAGAATGQDPLVIKNADLTIVVKDPAAKMQAIISMAEGIGGRVVNSNMSETIAPDGTKIHQGSLLVRVPEAKLDDAIKQIESDVVEVQSENRSGVDVTKEYTDLQSQLDNLNATEQQLTLIMQKADKTEDVLAVFNQLSQIRGQIDVIKGQMKYYEESAAMSAVTVTLIAQQSTQPISVAGWEPQGQARDAIQALVNFFQGFVNFLIWLVLLIIPALVIVVLPIFLIFLLVRAIVRRRRGKKAVSNE